MKKQYHSLQRCQGPLFDSPEDAIRWWRNNVKWESRNKDFTIFAFEFTFLDKPNDLEAVSPMDITHFQAITKPLYVWLMQAGIEP